MFRVQGRIYDVIKPCGQALLQPCTLDFQKPSSLKLYLTDPSNALLQQPLRHVTLQPTWVAFSTEPDRFRSPAKTGALRILCEG